MSTSTLAYGRIEFTPRPAVPKPQRGGRRPPSNGNNRLRSYPLVRLLTPRRYRRVRNTLQFCTVVGLSSLTTVLFLSSIAAAQPQDTAPLPNLAGTYSCEGDETACGWSGWTFTVTQSGPDLQIKNEKGEIGSGKITSRITLSAGPIWNMLGTIVSSDNRVIQWSNGTSWRKQ
jgi:hypothetical protein